MLNVKLFLFVFLLIFYQLWSTVSAQTFEIVQHPINTTVCEGSTATFTCVIFIQSGIPVAPAWRRNSVPIDVMRHTIVNNLTNANPPAYVSSTLTVSSTTTSDDGIMYQCGISVAISNIVMLNVAAPPMTAPTITEATLLSTTSFTVSWTITDPDHNYIITWINLHTSMVKGSMTVSENTNSYTVTGLNGIDNYNVSVSANNSCGMMMSDPITVYDAPIAPMNIIIQRDGITRESFIVQWDAVMDLFDVNYTVRWYGEGGSNGIATVNGLSYTVTGLIANTSYNVTVVAINTCCGAGPVSNVVMVMTNNEPPTAPPTSSSPPVTTPPVIQSCTITSSSANTIRVSCELLERINVTISSNSCTCSQPVTMVDNNPITVSDLPIGVYTVEVTAVNSNDMSIENNRIVEMITLSDKSSATDESDSSSLSTGATIAITCVITLLISVTVTAIVTAVIMYMLMKRKNESTPQDNINKMLYEEVTSPSHTSKNDVELQENPAYGTGCKVVMDTNPAYESYK